MKAHDVIFSFNQVLRSHWQQMNSDFMFLWQRIHSFIIAFRIGLNCYFW